MIYFFGSICAVCIASMVIALILAKYGTHSESKVFRAALRKLETETRAAQESCTLVQHNIEELRERLSDQRDADRARIARCEVQVEANERNMVKLGNQFKDEVATVRAEGTKLAMHVSAQQRKNF